LDLALRPPAGRLALSQSLRRMRAAKRPNRAQELMKMTLHSF